MVDDGTFNKLCRELAGDLKIARRQSGLSQEALALMAEVDRTYVSQLERGVANPSLQILCRLASALEMDIHLALKSRSVSSIAKCEKP